MARLCKRKCLRAARRNHIRASSRSSGQGQCRVRVCLKSEMGAEVLFEYRKENPDELDLKIGEIITNVTEVRYMGVTSTRGNTRT